jgi:hypothetical protein
MPARIAPLALTIIGAMSVAGIILLAALRQPIPDTLTTLATVSLSALAGALIPSMRDLGASSTGPTPSSPEPPAAPIAAAAVPAAPVQLVASQQPATAAVNPPTAQPAAA